MDLGIPVVCLEYLQARFPPNLPAFIAKMFALPVAIKALLVVN